MFAPLARAITILTAARKSAGMMNAFELSSIARLCGFIDGLRPNMHPKPKRTLHDRVFGKADLAALLNMLGRRPAANIIGLMRVGGIALKAIGGA